MNDQQPIRRLIELLNPESRVFVQTHNFPDHDAVAAAFGIHGLLRELNISSFIIYDGVIQRSSLRRMISDLHIPIVHQEQFNLTPEDQIIIVDGCKGHQNVSNLNGTEIGIVDHHLFAPPEDVPFKDIRPELGSSCTLVFSYYKHLNLPISKPIATALMVGINIDTANLTRKTSPEDIQAYAELFSLADLPKVNSIIRNNTQRSDLAFYRLALENFTIIDRFGFCFFPNGCDQNLLGILGDFFLGLEEIDFVSVAANNDKRIDISTRAESETFNCALILHEVVDSMGACGGHKEMAGGCLFRNKVKISEPLSTFLQTRFLSVLAKFSQQYQQNSIGTK